MIWNYNLETEDNTETFEEHDGAITKILVVNQKYIFSASEDGTIKKWNPKASGTTSEMTYTGHEASVNDIVMLDQKQMASGSQDKSIKIWEIPTKQCLFTLQGHQRSITKLIFIQDQQKIISGSLDETIRIWSRETRLCEREIDNGSKVRNMLFLGVHKIFVPQSSRYRGQE